jgi:hypothetical protein
MSRPPGGSRSGAGRVGPARVPARPGRAARPGGSHAADGIQTTRLTWLTTPATDATASAVKTAIEKLTYPRSMHVPLRDRRSPPPRSRLRRRRWAARSRWVHDEGLGGRRVGGRRLGGRVRTHRHGQRHQGAIDSLFPASGLWPMTVPGVAVSETSSVVPTWKPWPSRIACASSRGMPAREPGPASSSKLEPQRRTGTNHWWTDLGVAVARPRPLPGPDPRPRPPTAARRAR